ncbi:hypothetical protein ACVPR2_23360, partial [Salmonella enterica subsp. enterica serovar Enteritidis]
ISLPLVDCRGDNDTFESNGKARRIKIDFIGYLKLREDFIITIQKYISHLDGFLQKSVLGFILL